MGKIKKPLSKTRRIVTMSVCSVVICICIAALIVANFFLNKYSLIAHRFFAGDNVSASESNPVFEEADNVVRDAAADSMVLLENKDGFLPISQKKVNLFGWGSTEYGFLLTGGGSGGTSITNDKKYKIDPDDAFKQEGFTINSTLYKAYTDFSKFDADYRASGSTNAYVNESLKNPGASFYGKSRMDQAKEFSNVAVAFISRWGAENVNMSGSDELRNVDKYKNGTYLELTSEEVAMFDALQSNGFDVIVVLNVCNNIELGFVKDYSCVKACIFAGIPGQTGAIAIPQIISGKINPSGRISDTLPYDNQTFNPTYFNAAKSNGNLAYQEGIYFGYKWYETADAEGVFSSVSNKYGTGYDGVVQYPFGYGLSYTDFTWTADFSDIPENLEKDGRYDVKVTVKNTGTVAGKEVVQLYGHTEYKDGGIEKPERVLLDFAKTELLQPGEDQELALSFSSYDLASYDEYNKNVNSYTGYELEKGSVLISVQSDAHNTTNAKYASKQTNVNADIGYTEDPTTGNTVENRFTGATAYADMPIDGTRAYTGAKAFEYLSRKGHFENYDKLKQIAAPSISVESAAKYRHHDYDDEDTSQYRYGAKNDLYLVTREDGGVASMENLTGEEVTKLAFNEMVTEYLSDYDLEEWDMFLDQLTQKEIKNLIGQGGFTTAAVYSIGKPRCTDKDGPAGYNNNVSSPGKSSAYTLYPSESLTGCSFSKETAYKIGEAQGKIGTEFGINGWYGPGVNLHRTVFTSRNYEYYSEDATLSGLLAAETIKGAYDNHVYCYLKHMAVSEAGINPKEINTWLTEQALRENYLRPFEIAVKHYRDPSTWRGGANAIMSAFNRVGAVLSAYNKAMLTDILRDEWGFRGSVITDWFEGPGTGYADQYELGVLAGNDLWLCGTEGKDAALNLGNNAVKYAARQSAKNIIYTYIDTNLGNESIKVNPESYSGLFVFLWTLINLMFAISIVVCLWFILISIPFFRRHIPFLAKKDKRRAEAWNMADGSANGTVEIEAGAQEESGMEQSEDTAGSAEQEPQQSEQEPEKGPEEPEQN